MDEATFETGLDTRSCYVIQKHGTAMESQSGRSTGAINLGLKGPVHFLRADELPNIYKSRPKELGLPFFERCIRKEDI